jgi:RNA polymerase sigma-70 factor, ECF subfamily
VTADPSRLAAIQAARVARGDGPGEADPAGLDRERYDVAFEAFRPRLVSLARSLLGPEAAEDAVQDTYILGREAIGQLRDPAAVEGWLKRICVTRCYRVHRRRRVLDRVLARLAPAQPARDAGIRDLVEQLPHRQRVVIVLHYGHGYSLAEISELIDERYDNVRAIASRARRKLLEAWLESER